MTQLFKSDLFRNFLGGFLIGAIGMFVLLPEDGQAISAAASTESFAQR
ncbi:hypothetical protein C7451_11376 [Blastomonas natatoria]|uniref:Uncharacterized protein n=1 Tax=Blastomonas natatoria TaxID=34015 RepID=A0A2V3UTU8_9SPHN|nr:hypothetical protein [Blastomonas natatoria]PXW71330.1 hypothetical protein C7451_11376 [Blastomonas natatoria]